MVLSRHVVATEAIIQVSNVVVKIDNLEYPARQEVSIVV